MKNISVLIIVKYKKNKSFNIQTTKLNNLHKKFPNQLVSLETTRRCLSWCNEKNDFIDIIINIT